MKFMISNRTDTWKADGNLLIWKHRMSVSAFLFVNNNVACSHKLYTNKRLWHFYDTNIRVLWCLPIVWHSAERFDVSNAFYTIVTRLNAVAEKMSFLSPNRLYNLGLRQHTKASLLLELLTPTAFSIIIVIQLHFFHRPFLAMIDLKVRSNSATHQSAARGAVEPHTTASTSQQDGAGPSEVARESRQSTQKSYLVVALVNIVNFYNDLTVFLWRVGELHMLKLVNLTLIFVVLYQVEWT